MKTLYKIQEWFSNRLHWLMWLFCFLVPILFVASIWLVYQNGEWQEWIHKKVTDLEVLDVLSIIFMYVIATSFRKNQS